MQLCTIRYIVTVAKYGNITKAAEALYISQPALSQSIHRAEQELQADIFIRSKGQIALTPVGELIVREGSRMLEIEEGLQQQLSALLETQSRTVTIGAATSYQRFFLSVILSELQKLMPNMHFVIKDGYSAGMCEQLRGKALDFALVCEPFPEDLQNIPVFREEIFLAISQTHPLYQTLLDASEPTAGSPYAFVDLRLCRDAKFIVYPEGRRIQQILMNETRAAGFTPQISTVCVNTESANLMAHYGMGIAMIPGVTASLCTEQHRPHYFRLRREGLYRTLAIVNRPSQKHSDIQKQLVDILRKSNELFGENSASFLWTF